MDKYVIDVPFLQASCSWNNFTNKTKKSAAAYAKYGGTKVHHLLLFLKNEK
jgi:hypothetical protein